MSRPYCGRCKTQVILDSDGRSCPNCHAILVDPHRTRNAKPTPDPEPPTEPPPAPTKVSSLYPGRHTKKTPANPRPPARRKRSEA